MWDVPIHAGCSNLCGTFQFMRAVLIYAGRPDLCGMSQFMRDVPIFIRSKTRPAEILRGRQMSYIFMMHKYF